MKKFLALYMADATGMADMMRNSTPEQQKVDRGVDEMDGR
jgi:hypothetical protein